MGLLLPDRFLGGAKPYRVDLGKSYFQFLHRHASNFHVPVRVEERERSSEVFYAKRDFCRKQLIKFTG